MRQMLFLLAASSLPTLQPSDYLAWGRETLDQIRNDFYISNQKLYAEKFEIGKGRSGPAFCWPAGVMLSALAAGAKADTKYKPWLREYADALRSRYWNPQGPVPGFDVLPLPKKTDRYYDDNAWMGLALAETYEVLGDRKYLKWSEQCFDFVKSGESYAMGGGIYWRENQKSSKNTCSNAPSAVLALKLHEITGKREFFEKGQDLWEWTATHLQDPEDHLMWDSISTSRKIDKTKWSYNSALMLRTSRMLAKATENGNFADESSRISDSAVRRWVGPIRASRAPAPIGIRDEAPFAHLLAEAILTSSQNERHRELVALALQSLHNKVRDSNGHYGSRWDLSVASPLKTAVLIDQASAARAFFIAHERLAK